MDPSGSVYSGSSRELHYNRKKHSSSWRNRLLSLKAASERHSEGDDFSRFSSAEKLLKESELELVERIDISKFQDQHVVFVVKLLKGERTD